MLKAIGALISAIVFILIAFFQGGNKIDHFAAYSAIALVATLYLISVEKKWMIKLLCAIFFLGLLFKYKVIGPVYSVAFSASLTFIALLWVYFLVTWKEKLIAVEIHRQGVDEDIRILQDKFDARSESLAHLERQVTGLQNLFEVARDFNECLTYDELVLTLSKKVRAEIPYRKLSLAILDSKGGLAQEITRVFTIGNSDETIGTAHEPTSFDIFCVQQIQGQKKVVQITSAQAKSFQPVNDVEIDYPLWIFSIQSKDKMIAVLAVQGGRDDDFPKYELLVAQLALQVKKIELYGTVKELSIVDGLTKVFVRRHFLERFEEELKRAIKRRNPLTVLLLDIDNFKSYNDTFGHLVGDGTLREVAAVIREHVRKVDLVARYGGEEFVIVMPETSNPINSESAERIRSAVAQKKFRIYDEETRVTVSIGLTSFPSDLDDPKISDFRESLMLELIQKADKALYKAKEDGRNRVVSYHMIKNKG